MELEHFIAVLGLAYELPYVPDDNTRRESDLLHFSMVDNAFSFTTGMMHKACESIFDIFLLSRYLYSAKDFDRAKAGSSKSTPKSMKKHGIFAPASPALSCKGAALSSALLRTSLRASDTGKNIV